MGNNYSTINDSTDPCHYIELYNLATLCRAMQCCVDRPISMANYVQLCSTRGEHGNNPGLLMMAVDSLLPPLATALKGTRMTEIEVKTMLHNLAAVELIYQ
jgi:hypothetical protein